MEKGGVEYKMILEGYIAKWKEYPEDEIKIRVARPHLLSPSLKLLKKYKKGEISWGQYKDFFIEEMFLKVECWEEIVNINELSCYTDVRLMCYEKDPIKCHRNLLVKIMNIL